MDVDGQQCHAALRAPGSDTTGTGSSSFGWILFIRLTVHRVLSS
jgi:hypothetical protein